jgi:hypothetical protein
LFKINEVKVSVIKVLCKQPFYLSPIYNVKKNVSFIIHKCFHNFAYFGLRLVFISQKTNIAFE